MIDSVVIHVQAGDGGSGAVSFRRERYVPRGGPDGGDGGRGGDVVLVVNQGVSTLSELGRKRHFWAVKGSPGHGGERHGRDGADIEIYVPVGTVVHDDMADETFLLIELLEEGQRFILARGGKGGKGNARFTTAVHQTPRFAEAGGMGERGTYRLELKLLADVGIIGLPNVGKSTLLAAATAARPKVAPYPFTTLEPQLGVVAVRYETFTLADFPGLIEGAHVGAGLGIRFLQHIERARLLVHLVAGDSEEPFKDIAQVDHELKCYNPRLSEMPQVVVINKIDLPRVRVGIENLRKSLQPLRQQPYFISAATGEGVPELLEEILKLLRALQRQQPMQRDATVFRPRPTGDRKKVLQEDGRYILSGPGVPTLVVSRETSEEEYVGILRERLRRTGWGRVLGKAGVRPGDIVRAGEVEFVW